ncbi:MAG TPA: ABC transporter ATP-binding protein [Bauldia sp.]|nr:ABC transporter ATP-binding protein [Bauldia sp.]
MVAVLMQATGGPLLSVDNVSLSFGGIAALKNVSMAAVEGKVTAIIGPNGAGKTTLFNAISGFYRPQSGAITFGGIDLLGRPMHARSGYGIARTFQNIALFSGMTVLENIKLGSHARLATNVFSASIYLGWADREERALTERIDRDVIDFLDLGAVRDHATAGLNYGVQKRVELARALALQPRLMMLDEPVAGMNPAEKLEMAGYIRRCVEERGMTVLLIDHDMETVLGMSHHVVVLNFGSVLAAGAPDDVRSDPGVIAAYLGDD